MEMNVQEALAQTELKIDAQKPTFFAMSPDSQRSANRAEIPYFIFQQPNVELTFSREHKNGCISFSQDSSLLKKWSDILETFNFENEPLGEKIESYKSRSFTELSRSWVPYEPDALFRRRISKAISALLAHRDGKMAVTRGYSKKISNQLRLFDVFQELTSNNGDYASAHFFKLKPSIVSFSCSPENVFEICGESFIADVVAGTCKANDDPSYIERELTNNAKQIREHESSVGSRLKRFAGFCIEGSLQVKTSRRVRYLSNVSHLHTILAGDLKRSLLFTDMFGNLFPLLGARPKELLPIADSEGSPHMFYGGVFGYLSGDYIGCFLNLRSALALSDELHAKVGVGIIAEADEDDELLETQHKISALMAAVRAVSAK